MRSVWVWRLLAANVFIFLLSQLPGSRRLLAELVFVPQEALTRPWTLLTYAFLHAGFTHLLFNSIGLFFFGPRLEEKLGARGFLTLYGLGVLGGALFHLIPLLAGGTAPPVIGASGAIYGILISFAMIWPRERIYLWMILPVPAWILATVLVFGSLYAQVAAQGSNVAHLAHLGGAVFAGAYMFAHHRRERAQAKQTSAFSRLPQRVRMAISWSKIDTSRLHALNRAEVERLVDQVQNDGLSTITEAEIAFLNRMAGVEE